MRCTATFAAISMAGRRLDGITTTVVAPEDDCEWQDSRRGRRALMTCEHKSCQCEIQGCGLTHPKNWKPKMTVQINMTVVGGDDFADCMAHYLLQMGYPRDRPEHLRKVSESMAARREGKKSAQRA